MDTTKTPNKVSSTTTNKPLPGLVAALDIGTTKVCCLIAKPGGEAEMEVVGIGHHVSGGVKSGTIIDMERAEAGIRSTVEAAEQMAGENIREITVNVSCGEPRSRLIASNVSIAGHEVTDNDLRRVLDIDGLPDSELQDRQLLHTIPVGYSIDGNKGVRDPRGLRGKDLGVNMHMVTAADAPLMNLETAVSRCHLHVADKVVTPYASALATLVEDETSLGVTCLDMGGGTTSIAVFFDGELIHIDSIPVGGAHVTNDIARGLSAPLVDAERLKTLYGSAIPSPSDDREVIKVPLIGEEESGETNQVPRSVLVGIIRPRIEETFEMVRARLEQANFDKVSGRRIVLTGGASQLPGARELAATLLDKQVRLGKPKPLPGLAEAVSGPAFSACTGLLQFAFNNPAEASKSAYRPNQNPGGRFARLGQWLRENF
ncbi:MAG: cell division protein FtsA [Rhodospirillaceae bacterium]|jgi:cell division protein FtsA|nr:cell division protein FtsA [Rhodospirillaceae bacterium]MBT4218778.1 cell division protein FtsA [Rhodospirillaceae bacterium]MBT4463574.1 cell division protein FtsA [Rhodospirillaceae bacterium]MBT6407811.1 cell division protein FtsA [Rhodospirillaceae bacterium]MBT7356751.1 cell division protein FtsA [Rhodospirillaceae bacterium]